MNIVNQFILGSNSFSKFLRERKIHSKSMIAKIMILTNCTLFLYRPVLQSEEEICMETKPQTLTHLRQLESPNFVIILDESTFA